MRPATTVVALDEDCARSLGGCVAGVAADVGAAGSTSRGSCGAGARERGRRRLGLMCDCHRGVAMLEGTGQAHGHGERLGPLDLDVQAERLPKTGEE